MATLLPRFLRELQRHFMRPVFATLSAVVLVLGYALNGGADEIGTSEDLQFFESKIRPLFIEHCYECHSQDSDKLRGNLLLDSKAGWLAGGDSGEPAIVPGDPENSLVLQTIRHQVPGMEMPPDRPQLTDRQINDLAEWIRRGAIDPRSGGIEERKRADASWWSLQPIATQFKHSTIDAFVDEKLVAAGLKRNPPADPRTLLRRLYYDLHGLPPTNDEVQQFVTSYQQLTDRDAQIELIETWIDKLLDSPRYGERWGRHWLDVVRFGESIGFERNEIVNNIYPFRDYVIRSINDDKPFHQFVKEHLAGDVVGKNQPEVEIGSAYLVAGPWDDVGNQDPVAAANIRAATLDEIITTTGSAFLGMTIHCARCHHHKFDPIPTEDYYRLRSVFEGVSHGSREVTTQEARREREVQLAPLQSKVAKLQEQRSALISAVDTRAATAATAVTTTNPASTSRSKIDSYGTEETFAPVQAKFVRFVVHSKTTDDPAAGRRSGIGGQLTEFEVWTAESTPQNIALASLGTKATGAKSMRAEDFADAYGPQHVIDGVLGEAWFIGNPAVLTLELVEPANINKVRFFNARGDKETTDDSQVRGGTPCEYDIQISLDGNAWHTVASDEGREPWSDSHRIGRLRLATITPQEQQEINELDQKISEVNSRIAAVPALPHWFVGHRHQPTEPTRVHQGGDPTKPLAAITARSPAFLDGAMSGYDLGENAPEALRRLAFAQWLVRDDNPLTRRVIVNRIWHYHFGTGIVDSPSDFGYLGSLPSHPELLDFLAERFRIHGWRWKPLHKEILLSESYLQSGADTPEGTAIDKGARLLWKFPTRRLSAEEIRDTMLATTNKLQLEPMGGPGFRLYHYMQNNVSTYSPLDQVGPETYRRSVYHQNARASVIDMLSDFDFPDIAFSAPSRASTISPMQALVMMNHSFVSDMGNAMAERIDRELGDSDATNLDQLRIRKAFELYLQRQPTPAEFEIALPFLQRVGLAVFCRAMFNANEFVYID